MKANEAPEKIYVVIDPIWGSMSVNYNRNDTDNVEYSRTDAFIDKAVKFMEKIDDVDEYSWYNEEEHAAGITEECIEDFKKYMKGE